MELSESLDELSRMVWAETLGLTLDAAGTIDGVSPSRTVEAHVHISGEWRGTLVLQCGYRLGARAASRMFQSDEAAATVEDVQDAIGELTNMIGGNVKALLSSDGCFLSLPVVVEGHDYRVHVPRSRTIAREAFTCDGDPLVVTLLAANG